MTNYWNDSPNINPQNYQFCPKCGKELSIKIIENIPRLQCKSCKYIFYQNPTPAVAAILLKEKEVLLVKRKYDPKAGDWCLPAGFMEWKEHPSQTAVRELKEETGLDVSLDELFNVYSGDDDPRTNAVLILYLAHETGGRLEAADDALEARYFRFDQLPDKIAFISHKQAIADYMRRLQV